MLSRRGEEKERKGEREGEQVTAHVGDAVVVQPGETEKVCHTTRTRARWQEFVCVCVCKSRVCVCVCVCDVPDVSRAGRDKLRPRLARIHCSSGGGSGVDSGERLG